VIAGLTQYSQSRVSTERILTFLELEELVPYVDTEDHADGTAVAMTDVSMSWLRSEETQEDQAKDKIKAKDKGACANPDSDQEEKTDDASAGGVVQLTDVKLSDSTTAGGAARIPTPSEVDDVNASATATASRGTGSGHKYQQVNSTADETAAAAAVTKGAGEGVGAQAATNDASLYVRENDRSLHTLVDLNFTIQTGELVAVVGNVGCGKSSLLSGLLGELILSRGNVRVCGRIAYCDQRPWILNDTVQGNVLFGLPYDEARFDAALHAANLEEDLLVLPGGVNTQIGNLHGLVATVCCLIFSFSIFVAWSLFVCLQFLLCPPVPREKQFYLPSACAYLFARN
jgi:ABC-type multidrug transport system fused ATPase/permease subunit